MADVWLSLADSQMPQALAAAIDFVRDVSDMRARTDAVLELVDSPAQAVSAAGLALLDELSDRLDVDRVYESLTEHPSAAVQQRIADVADDGQVYGRALEQFDRRVLLGAFATPRTRAQVRQRWARRADEPGARFDADVLLRLATTGDRREQEWAFDIFARRAAIGRPVRGVTVSAATPPLPDRQVLEAEPWTR